MWNMSDVSVLGMDIMKPYIRLQSLPAKPPPPHSKPHGTNSDWPSQQSPQYSLSHLSNTKWLTMIQSHSNMLVKKRISEKGKIST